MRRPVADRRHPCLSGADTALLLGSLAQQRGPRSFTRAEADVLLDWAEEVRQVERALRYVLEGVVRVDVREGKPYFIVPGAEDA